MVEATETRSERPTARYRATAIVAAVMLVFGCSSSLAAAPVGDPPLGASDLIVRWGVLGVTADRRSLVVAATGQTPTCSSVRVDRLAADAKQIRLRVVFKPRAGTEADTYCQENSMSKPPEVLTVPVGRKVAGQTITGASKVSSHRLLTSFAPDPDETGGRRTWPVAGLRAADALNILRGLRIRTADVSVAGPRSGYVVAVEPALPKFLVKSRRVRLTTRHSR